MFRFILGIIFVIIALVFFAFRRYYKGQVEQAIANEQRPDADDIGLAEGNKWGFRICLIIGLLFMVWSTVRIVPAQNTAVAVRFGNTIGVHDDGFTFAAPWDQFNNFSLRVQTLENSNSEGAIAGPIAGRASDTSTFDTDGIVRYSIPEDQALVVFDEYGTDRGAFEREVINADFRSVVRQVMSGYAILNLDANRSEMETMVCNQLNERWGRIARCESVVLRNIDIDDDVEAQAEAVNIAKQKAEEAVFTLERTETLAQGEVIEAAATADAQAILECGYTIVDEEIVPNAQGSEACGETLTDRGLFVRCLATVAGTQENALPNNYLFPLDCTSILTGQPSGGVLGDADLLIQP